jgi:hypothetical protein
MQQGSRSRESIQSRSDRLEHELRKIKRRVEV